MDAELLWHLRTNIQNNIQKVKCRIEDDHTGTGFISKELSFFPLRSLSFLARAQQEGTHATVNKKQMRKRNCRHVASLDTMESNMLWPLVCHPSATEHSFITAFFCLPCRLLHRSILWSEIMAHRGVIYTNSGGSTCFCDQYFRLLVFKRDLFYK